MTDEKLLDGIKVLDLSTYVTGGFAGLMLANQGAEVIKIERPEVGDGLRHTGPPFVEGESPYFWSVNYGKKSMELNLKSDKALEIFYELAKDADVVIENFRPGVADRLGIGYEDVKKYNDSIVYCSISAFGDSGPWKKRPGFDLLVQGMSGIMSTTGEIGGDPVKVGAFAVTDLITASWSAFGIVSALQRREKTGEGERVEMGMLDGVLPWLTKQAGKALFSDEEPSPMGTRDPVQAPYQMYQTKDSYMNVCAPDQGLWERLCKAIDREELIEDERFKDNASRVENVDELQEELEKTLKQKTTDEWVEIIMEEHGVPVGPVNTVTDALTNEQVEHREMVKEIEHTKAGKTPVVDHPLNFENHRHGFESHAPLLGEHSREIISELGYNEEEIEEMKEEGVFAETGLK